MIREREQTLVIAGRFDRASIPKYTLQYKKYLNI